MKLRSQANRKTYSRWPGPFDFIATPIVMLEYASESFYFSVVNNWNEIPDEIPEKESIFRLRQDLEIDLLNLKDPNTTPW